MANYNPLLVTTQIDMRSAVTSIDYNVAVVSVHTETKITECFKTTDLSAAPAPVKDTIGAIFAGQININKVYWLQVKSGEEASLSNYLKNNDIWALVIADSTLGTQAKLTSILQSMGVDVSAARSGYGMVFAILDAANYVKPTFTNDRLAYFRTPEYQPMGMLACDVLTSIRRTVFANVKLNFKIETPYTHEQMQTFGGDNVNSFIPYDGGCYCNYGVTSTGEWLGNMWTLDHVDRTYRFYGQKYLLENSRVLTYDPRGAGFAVGFAKDLIEKKFVDEGLIAEGAFDDAPTRTGDVYKDGESAYQLWVPASQSDADKASRIYRIGFDFLTAGQMQAFHFGITIITQ